MRSINRIAAAAAAVTASLAIFAVTATGNPSFTRDIGRGERLALVIGGSFASYEEARAGAMRWTLDEIEGFYLSPSGDFEGMASGRWLLLSAFRTMRGAKEFQQIAATSGFPDATRVIARYLGDAYIGLGQEPHPDGNGPLSGPLQPAHPERL